MDFTSLYINGYPVFTLFWNIFLLSIPFFLGHVIYKISNSPIKRKYLKYSLISATGFMWLLFIPNTVYVITDIRHLNEFCPQAKDNVCLQNAWQILFFYAYSLVGWIAYVYSLNQMKRIVRSAFGRRWSGLFITLIIPVIALGSLLGLIDRWNSWEFFLYPREIVKNGLLYLLASRYLFNFLIFSLVYYVLYFAGDRLFVKNINIFTKPKI